MNPFFSILIPVYNQVGKMDRCIDSLKAQDFRDFEAIFTNDGSTDDSAAMLERFAAGDSRFRLSSHDRNSSLLAARYTGMNLAAGEYILFLDSDDWLEDDALSLIHDALMADNQRETEILRFGYIREPEGTGVLPYATDHPRNALLNGEFPPAIWKNCYRRDVIDRLLERTGPFYCNMGEDVYFSGVLFGCAEHFNSLEKNLYHYDLGTGMSSIAASHSPKKTQRDLDSVKAAGEKLQDFTSRYMPEELPRIKRKTADMICFVLAQCILGEADWNRIPEHLAVFNTSETRQYFFFGCEELVPLKMRFSLGLLDRDKLWKAYLERQEKLYQHMGLI